MSFRIRSEQYVAFSAQFESRFAKHMARHLAETFPKQVEKQGLRAEDLEPLALRGIADARKYGVVDEEDVQRYIECLVLLGPRFDTDERFPWAGDVLRRTDLDGEEKVDLIDEHLVFGLGVGT